jgi:hypothetical protein
MSKKAYSIAEYEYDSEDKWVHNVLLFSFYNRGEAKL